MLGKMSIWGLCKVEDLQRKQRERRREEEAEEERKKQKVLEKFKKCFDTEVSGENPFGDKTVEYTLKLCVFDIWPLNSKSLK